MAKPYGRIYNNNKNVSITPLDIKDLYPVGSIYLTVSDIYPGDYFGGTWVKVSGGFLYGSVNTAGDVGNGTGTATNAATGNTGSTTLTVDQIPSHNHQERLYFHGYSGFSGGSSGNVYVFNWSSGNCIVNQNSSNTSSYTSLCNQPDTHNRGGGQGHTHSLNNHTHNIPYIGVWVWKRTA